MSTVNGNGFKAFKTSHSPTPSIIDSAPSWRFSLLQLEDGDYPLQDVTCCYYCEEGFKIQGELKICTLNVLFVPKDYRRPILRIHFRNMVDISPCDTVNELFFSVDEYVELRKGDRDVPYEHIRGMFPFHFVLSYTRVEDIYPRLIILRHLAQLEPHNKAERAEQAAVVRAIIDEHEEAEMFCPGWLDDDEEIVLELAACSITPLCSQPGRLALTCRRLLFQPFGVAVAGAHIQALFLTSISQIAVRRHGVEDIGLELFFSQRDYRDSFFLTCRSKAERNRLEGALKSQPAVVLDTIKSQEQWTSDWVAGRVSNFDYILHLNIAAGRSFQDLAQYPVFPWVLQDYTSLHLDLEDAAVYRDLSKPIGALNPARLKMYKERYAELARFSQGIDGAPLPFLYGCHYSSPGYVVFYLLRSHPQLMLRLQNGRFDSPDRLFLSIEETWRSVMQSTSDVKELIPEFYSEKTGLFLRNSAGLNLGVRSSGEAVGDVQLPPWAESAADFVRKMAAALENHHVSNRLHKWIDLIFGVKSRGEPAVEADNVFHYLTYDEIAFAELENESEPLLKDALQVQIMEFGRTPSQLFKKKHPRRKRRNAILSCLVCGAPPPQSAVQAHTYSPSPPKHIALKASTPVARAIAKIATGKRYEQKLENLEWLEKLAATKEPDEISLRTCACAGVLELCALPTALGRDGVLILARTVSALAVCHYNRQHMVKNYELIDALTQNIVVFKEDSSVKVRGLTALADLFAPDSHLTRPPVNPVLVTVVAEAMSADDQLVAAACRVAGAIGAPQVWLQSGVVAQLQSKIQGKDGLQSLSLLALRSLAAYEEEYKEVILDKKVLEVLLRCLIKKQGGEDVQVASLEGLAIALSVDSICQEIGADLIHHLLAMLATSKILDLQRLAAACLAIIGAQSNFALVIAQEEGVAALGSQNYVNGEVQRHITRILWHVCASPEAMSLALNRGALDALPLLAVSQRSMRAQRLARQTLSLCLNNPRARKRLEVIAMDTVNKPLESLVPPSSNVSPTLAHAAILASPAKSMATSSSSQATPISKTKYHASYISEEVPSVSENEVKGMHTMSDEKGSEEKSARISSHPLTEDEEDWEGSR